MFCRLSGVSILQSAGLQVTSNPEGGSLSLAMLPAFGTRWLAPRLSSFLVKHPGITIHVGTRIRRFDFDTETFDAAIHFGRDDWPSAQHMELFPERMTACIAPSLLSKHHVGSIEDIASLPLLQMETRPSAWTTWFRAQGVAALEPNGMSFDLFAAMTQAAIHGLGVALLPEYLAEVEITEGRLLPLFQRAVPSALSYWLVWPASRADPPPLKALRTWLKSEMEMTRAGPSEELKRTTTIYSSG